MGKQCKYPFCIAEVWNAIPENVDWQAQEGDCICGNRVKRDVDIYCNKCGRKLLWENVTYCVALETKKLDVDGERLGVWSPCCEDWWKQIARKINSFLKVYFRKFTGFIEVYFTKGGFECFGDSFKFCPSCGMKMNVSHSEISKQSATKDERCGEWEYGNWLGEGTKCHKCSLCGWVDSMATVGNFELFPFCPNCGTRMK